MNAQPFDINTPRSADGFWHCKTRDGRDAVFTNIPAPETFGGTLCGKDITLTWHSNGMYTPEIEDGWDLDLSTVETLPKDEYVALKQAHKDGKVIQLRPEGHDHWEDVPNPSFCGPVGLYRIKPEPVRVPLTAADVPPLTLIREQGWPTGTWEIITGIEIGGVRYGSEFKSYKQWDELQDEGQKINRPRHRDADGNPTLWEPCYKEQEAE